MSAKARRLIRAVSALLRPAAWVIVAVVVAAAATFSVDRRATAPQRREADRRTLLASAIASGLQAWFAGGKAEAEGVGAQLEPWTGDSRQAAAARASMDSLLPAADLLGAGAIVVDQNLRVISTSSSRAAVLGLERDGPHIRAALAGTTTFSGVTADRLDHIAAVEVAAPLRDGGGAVRGALVLRSPLSGGSLTAALERQALSGLDVFLVDPGNLSLAATAPTSAEPASRDARRPAERARESPDPGFLEYQGEAGVAKVAGYAPLPDGWAAVVAQDAGDFYSVGRTLGERLRESGPTRTSALLFLAITGLGFATIARLRRLLRRAKSRAEEAKRAFLAITGHELRTPLTVIRGTSQTLASRWSRIKPEQRKEMITTINRQALSLEHLIERLIAGAELEAGVRGGSTARPFDIAPLLEKTVEHYQALSRIHELELSADTPLMVLADPKPLEQVVGHLLENAIKYSPAGGKVWVTGRRSRARVVLTVEDEGVGLPADPSIIFQKFAQGELVDTRVHDEGGVGLGLFIARTHLERMGARIRAERRDSRGSRFVVTLRAANLPNRSPD